MGLRHRSLLTSRRQGFTLIELMVAMALTVILGLVAFMGQRYMGVVIARTTERINVRSNMSLVMDQVTKELRETTTVSGGVGTNDGGRANYGVTLPTFSSTSPTTRHLNDVIASSPVPPLSSTQMYSFSAGPTNPILEFFTIDDSQVKHRIRYSLGAPVSGSGTYAGLGQGNWVDSAWEPCCVTYQNNSWNGAAWSAEPARIVTDQVIKDFTVTRVSWSSNVVQISIIAFARNLSGQGYSPVTLVGLVALRR